MPKAVKILLLCIFSCLLFCSCAKKSGPSYDISGYIGSFEKMDYTAMYSYCQPVVDIKQDAFVKKYSDIFSGLGVTKIGIVDLKGPDKDGTYTYTATYKTKDYGDIKSSFTLKTGFKNNQCVVFWDYSLIFPEMGDESTVQVQTLKADRGEIFGSDGTPLAKNSYADTVYMDATKVTDISAVARVICPLTGITNAKLVDLFNKAVQKGTTAVALGAYLPGTLTDQQRTSILAVAGLGIDNEKYTVIRNYPLGEAAAHIIGYIGTASKDDIAKGYSSSDKVGKMGLEKQHESELRGKDGKIVYIKDKWGKNVRTLYKVDRVEGEDLRLTIDPKLQQEAYNSLKNNLTGKQTGAAIVIDADTGYVKALASYPSYDDNLFNFPVTKAVYDTCNFNDWATQGAYPPGSSIKPFTSAIALESGSINTATQFTGTIVKNKWSPEGEGWTVTRADDAAGNHMNLEGALVHSDNIFFAWTALKVGNKTFSDYLTKIGFTESVPFDLGVKNANLINKETTIDDKMLADMGYGQAELLVTPLQLATMYTAFANGTGNMMQPMLIQKICRTDGYDYKTISEKNKTVWKGNAVSKSSIDTLKPFMEEVVTKGTATAVKIPGVTIAGKTGTAEIGNDKSREISWFSGFWVGGSYNRLVVVMVDAAANEGTVKFNVAKDLLTP